MMIDDILAALLAAWRVAVVATALLYAALAVAPAWDSKIYFEALALTLTMDRF
jgi:hypothetical protein